MILSWSISIRGKELVYTLEMNCHSPHKQPYTPKGKDIRGKFFPMRVVRCWNSCPERLWMPCPSLEVFKARLDGALGSLGCYEMWRLVALPVAGVSEIHDP